jgi:XTP/dITP diphosphohydrolase
MNRVVLATGNRGKAREIQALLGPDWQLLLQADCGVTAIEETGASFAANALAKARHAAAATGLPALADDSGLEVDALGGAPAARFRCVLAYLPSPDADPVLAEGIWEGRITRIPRGIAGFGYDPVFEDPACGLTAAEMAPATKNERSHRGRALRALRSALACLPPG